MIKPFMDDPEVGGIRGRYLCKQPELTARFVQIEYEDRYRLLEREASIDFIDTYSAGYRRSIFLDYNGFDTSFPVACAEDIELSYRMSAGGVKMLYMPLARVYHSHPATISDYIKKKYKFAYWRILALKKNRRKAIKDAHTPQVMKLQLLMVPVLVATAALSWSSPTFRYLFLVSLAAFLAMTIPFSTRAWRSDSKVALVSPVYLSIRAFAQFAGVAMGTVNLFRQ